MAFGDKTFTGAAGAVGDLLGGQATASGLRLKARGSEVEGENYDLAAQLAKQNEEFSRESTAVKQTMADRQMYQTVGAEQSQIAASGFGQSGSALDILRDSASQGAMTHALVSQQGLIEEASYHEQATAYGNLAKFARYAAGVENEQADDAITNSYISGGIKGASSIATMFTGGVAGGGEIFSGDGSQSSMGGGYGGGVFT